MIDLPDFIHAGAFDWTQLGLSYDRQMDDGEQAAPGTAAAVWQDMDQIVRRAKAGDFRGLQALPDFVTSETETNVSPVAILLIGDIGGEHELEFLAHLLNEGAEGPSTYAAGAAALAGTKWLLPHMLTAWKRADSVNGHETIGYAISDLLEAPATFDSETELSSIVGTNPGADDAFEAKFEELLARVDTAETSSVWGGQAFNVYRFAEKFYQMLTHEDFSVFQSAITVRWRHKFEAATGMDCSAFYREGRIHQLSALSTLEEFLERHCEDDLHDGARYFFGHQLS